MLRFYLETKDFNNQIINKIQELNVDFFVEKNKLYINLTQNPFFASQSLIFLERDAKNIREILNLFKNKKIFFKIKISKDYPIINIQKRYQDSFLRNNNKLSFVLVPEEDDEKNIVYTIYFNKNLTRIQILKYLLFLSYVNYLFSRYEETLNPNFDDLYQEIGFIISQIFFGG